MTIIEGIAERIGAIRYVGLPAEAVHWAKMAILDTVGVTLAGAAEPCAQIVERVLATGATTSSGECLILGTDRRAAPLDAALINGTAAHALDFDDVSNSRSCRRCSRSARSSKRAGTRPRPSVSSGQPRPAAT